MSAQQEPLTPADCDLRDFQFMPLDVVRLRDSDLVALETPEACLAAILLWAASWHQVPAASLPNDDRVLANLAGYGRAVKEWQRVKEGAMRGFVFCSDGRFYHSVVAEKAVEAWNAKLERMWKTECARIKKHNQRCNTDLPYPTLEAFLSLRTKPTCPEGQIPSVPRDNIPVSPETNGVVPTLSPGFTPPRDRERDRESKPKEESNVGGTRTPPAEIEPTRKGLLSKQLRQLGIDAAPHVMNSDAWTAMLAVRTDDDILAVAEIAKANKPGERISLNYLLPMLRDQAPASLTGGQAHATRQGSVASTIAAFTGASSPDSGDGGGEETVIEGSATRVVETG